MKKIAIAAVLTAGLALSACEANVKDEGELPSVDVDVSGDAGKLPEVDVETADVEVGTKEVTVDVPEVDVKMPSEK
ncbi:hypothetical protein [Parasphingorhabdus sp.]|uniref:hypothetical protein n=1 Tax=Parasphingorhabdus sp. TaxID=2709688 RepID=UPI001B5A777F|nr:hypothetical protein [Parasphingorhabdus sp.]MBQ0770432.1 hypothetical protein [Sphingomonadales bacterium]|tara:strand:- start:2272 stop:2499 length:228 start_codon:yes stop_codon:yes gene_type:complete